MNVIQRPGSGDLLAIGFAPGEMLLESLRAALVQHGVRNGAVVSGIGTLKTCRMHYVTHTEFPPTDRIYTVAGPLELLSVNGIIADGEPHLHTVVSCGEDKVWGGHLEDGSEVLYLAEFVVMVFNEMPLRRRLDPVRKIKLLDRADS